MFVNRGRGPARSKGLSRLVALVASVSVLAVSAPANAAELVTAELDAVPNEVTVTQGQTANFTISVTATGQAQCGSTSSATVDTAFAISATGVTSSSTPSAALAFSAPGSGNNNCQISPTSVRTVAASVTAAAGTPLGTYSVTLSESAGTTGTTNSNPTGGKLEDKTPTTITFRVVAPTNRAPTVSTSAPDVSGAEGSVLATSGRFSDLDGDTLAITKLSGAGTVTPSATTPGGWSWALTPADQGSGTVVVRASDGHGGSVSDSFDWSASNVAPVLVTTASDATGVEGDVLTASGSFTDVSGDLPLTITQESGPGTLVPSGDGGWSWSLGTADDVSDTVVVRASDGDGGVTEDSFAVTALNVIPGVATDAPDVSGDEGSTIGNGGAFSDLDPLTISKTSGPGDVTDNHDRSWSWSYAPADDGVDAVTVTADDGDGGTQDDSFQVTARNVAPALVVAANDPAGAEGTELTAAGSFTDVAADPIAISKVSGAGTVVDNGNGTWTWTHTPGDDGDGTVVVRADDGDGGTTEDRFAWTASNADPTVDDAAQPATGTEGNTLTTTGSFSDVPADTLTITNDSGAGTVVDNGDGTWSWSLPTNDNVTGSVTVRATDDDGGTTTNTFTYTATNVAPDVTTAASDVTGDEGTTFGTAGAFSDVPGDPIKLALAPGSVGSLSDNGDGTWQWSLDGADDAAGDVTVVADDGDGDTTEDTFHYVIRNVNPTVTAAAVDPSGAEGSLLTASGSFGDVPADQPDLSVTKQAGDGTVQDLGNGAWAWQLTPTDNGSGTVVVEVTDGDGGSVSDSFDWSASNVAPVLVAAAADATGVEGDVLAASGSFTDVSGDLPLTITQESGPGTLVPSGDGGWSWSLATTDDVSGTVVVRASDGDGGVTKDSFEVTAVNVIPGVATDALDVAGDEGSAFSNGGAFSDLDDLTISKIGGPGDVTDNHNRSWSWSYAPADDETATVTVTADDGDGGTQDDSFQVTVRNVAPRLVVAANGPAGAEGTELTAAGSFTDVAADPIAISQVSGAGTVVDKGDGTWTWTHTPDDDGTGTVVVQADDGDGGITQDEFDWTARNADPTVDDAAQPATGTEGNTLTTTGSFTDVPADTLTITQDSGPGDLIDNHDGTWSWSMDTTDNITGTVTVRVTDDDDGTTTNTFTYTATNVAPAISGLALTGGATGTACQNGNNLGLAFTVGDPGSDDSITGTVSWGDGQVEPFSGRSVSVGHVYVAGTYTVTVNAEDDDGGHAVSRTATVSRTYQVSAIQSPFNADGSSVFKAGSTVPVKVRITDCLQLSVPNLAPTIRVALVGSATPSGTINETPDSTSAADTTGYLRYDPAGAQYIYNMATKSLPDPNAKYLVTVALGEVKTQLGFGLRSK